MTIPGSDGNIDLEYSPDPDHRQSAQELWFRKCDKRISALELAVHRLLNAEHPPEADYAHIPAAEWQDICAELESLRSTRPDMDENGVTLSHDAYDALEREAAIGRSVPFKLIAKHTILVQAYERAFPKDDTDYTSRRVLAWLKDYAPKEAAE